jgi:hypothetical protein
MNKYTSFVYEELFEESDFIYFAIELIKDEESLSALLTGENQTVILKAMTSLKSIGKLTEDYKQQGMINIFMADSDPSDEDSSISAMIRVNIVYNTDKWELIDGDCRTLALADRVIASLDKKKLTVSNPVEYVNTQELIISKQLVGYALLFDIVDGNSELENF